MPHLPKDRVLLVQPFASIQREEELAAIAVGLVGVGARHNAAVVELEPSVEFVLEGLTVDGLATCAVYTSLWLKLYIPQLCTSTVVVTRSTSTGT